MAPCTKIEIELMLLWRYCVTMLRFCNCRTILILCLFDPRQISDKGSLPSTSPTNANRVELFFADGLDAFDADLMLLQMQKSYS